MNSDVNQRPLLCCKFAKNDNLQSNVDLVNDNVDTKFNLSKSIRSQDTEEKSYPDVYQGL